MLHCHNPIQKLLKMSTACNVLESYTHKFQVEISFFHCRPGEEFLNNSGNKQVEKNDCLLSGKSVCEEKSKIFQRKFPC